MRSYSLFFLSFFSSCVAMAPELKPRSFYGAIEKTSSNNLKDYTQNIDSRGAVFLPGQYTFLHLAAMLKLTDEARTILDAKKYDINEHDNERGLTPLLIACNENDAAMAHLLLFFGANPCIPNKKGTTPLIKAIQKENMNLISLLLVHNVDVNQKDLVNDNTPLHMAIVEGNSDIVQLLLTYNASPNIDLEHCFTPLMAAAQMDIECAHDETHCLRIVKSLLDAKADHAIAYLEDQDTALHIAVGKWNKEAVYLLLKAGADANALNSAYETPLHIALYNVKNGLHQGYDASQQGCAIAKLLLLYGAKLSDKQLKNIDLNGILTAGIVTSTSELVKFSLYAGANDNYKNAFSDTPLHILAQRPKKDKQSLIIALLLLGHGADINLLNAKKRRALDFLLEYMCKHQQKIAQTK